MRQTLESCWQTNKTGRVLNLNALQKEKLLRVSSSFCSLRRPEDTESSLQTENGLGSCLMIVSQEVAWPLG